jgi:hypothetical protein
VHLLGAPVERQLEDATKRLLEEFRGVFPPETVVDAVRRAYHRSDDARVRQFSAIFAYRHAREDLRERRRLSFVPWAERRGAS